MGSLDYFVRSWSTIVSSGDLDLRCPFCPFLMVSIRCDGVPAEVIRCEI